MIRHLIGRMAFTVGVLLVIAAGPGLAQSIRPDYRVHSWGYYDRYPYPSPIGSSVIVTNGPPTVTYVDPWGRVADMPLRPKVLYGNTPFLTPGGYYYPVSISVIPDSRRPRVVPIPPPPAAHKVESPKREPIPMIPKARDFDAIADPDLPPVPKLEPLPKPPPIPGVPNLGPAPGAMPEPSRKPR